MNDTRHKTMYEQAVASAGVEAPAWEDLPEERKAKIRKVNDDHTRFMNDLSDAIVKGTPLPNPLDQEYNT